MAIPSVEGLMKKVIDLMSNGKVWERKDLILHIKQELIHRKEVSEEEASQKLEKSGQYRLDNRIAWAITHLHKAGILEKVGRAMYKLSEHGLYIYQKGIEVNMEYLRRIPSYSEWLSSSVPRGEGKQVQKEASESVPFEERLDTIIKEYRENLKRELLDILRKIDSYKFEKILLELLRKMGYGEPYTTSRTRDEGIDGVVMADKFGFDEVYIQAKRWGSRVGVDTINEFIGALTRKGASNGVLITTSDFSEDAKKAVEQVRSRGLKIVLIDGERLSELMIEYNVGVYIKYTHEIKAIDENFFEEV